MKLLFLIVFALLFGFVSQDVFAETQMTGWLRIMDSYSTDPGPHPYLITFHPDDQSTSYRLNSNTMSSGVLDWAGERVRVTVDDTPLANSFNSETQFLDITSIELVNQPLASSPLQIPAAVRSVTLLSMYSDIAIIPEESENTAPGQFINPQGVAVDIAGNIYVVEQGQGSPAINHRVQKFDSSGNFTLKFGQLGTGDGQFKFPSGIAVDSLGNIYVADNNNHRIQKFDSNGVFVGKIGTNGGDGTSGTAAGEFNLPFGVAIDGSDNVYVADTGNHRIQILDSSLGFIKMFGWGVDTGAAAFEVCITTCQAGAAVGNPGGFGGPRGVTVDDSGNIYVADTGVSRIQKFSSAPVFLTQFGSIGVTEGLFTQPRGVAVDDSGNIIYVADTNNHRIQKFDATTTPPNFLSMWGWGVDTGAVAFETCTSSCLVGLAGSGVGQLDTPEGIANGSVFVAETGNDRVKKFDANGAFLPLEEIGFDGSLSHDQAYYEGIFYNNPGSLKNFYAASSYGKFIWNGEVSNWTNVTSPKTTYANPSDFDLMITDAITAHETSVDFCNVQGQPNPVTNLILIFNGPISPSTNTAFGSLGIWNNVPENKIPWDTLDGCDITISVSWEPDNGGFFCCGQTLDKGIGVTGHELGHNQGFEHTPPPPGDWSVAVNDPYHDPNSIMSFNRDREGPSALITGQRDQVGWMDAGNKVTIADGTSSTITLDFINEVEGGVNPQMALIPLSDGTSYIVEAHQEEIFNDTPQDRIGVIMYKQFISCPPDPCGNQYPYLTFDSRDQDARYSLVATAGTDAETDFDEAMLEVGESYVDGANSVTVTTQSKDATSVTVLISNNAVSSCSPSAGVDWVITASCTLAGDVTADMNITVQDNSVLTVPDGFRVFFDPTTFSITVISGSGILIEQGGSIQTTP